MKVVPKPPTPPPVLPEGPPSDPEEQMPPLVDDVAPGDDSDEESQPRSISSPIDSSCVDETYSNDKQKKLEGLDKKKKPSFSHAAPTAHVKSKQAKAKSVRKRISRQRGRDPVMKDCLIRLIAAAPKSPFFTPDQVTKTLSILMLPAADGEEQAEFASSLWVPPNWLSGARRTLMEQCTNYFLFFIFIFIYFFAGPSDQTDLHGN